MCRRLNQNDNGKLILNSDQTDEVFNRSQAEDKVKRHQDLQALLHLDAGALSGDEFRWDTGRRPIMLDAVDAAVRLNLETSIQSLCLSSMDSLLIPSICN